MSNRPNYQNALGVFADALEEIRDAFGTVRVAHQNCCVIPEAERTMMIGCALVVIGAAFEKIDNIYCKHSQ